MRTAILVFLSCLAAVGAEAAQVGGIVVDASGAPVAGAVVTAGAASVTTADDGSFSLADVSDAGAELRVTAAGFAPATLTVRGDAQDVRVVLQPAPLVDTIVVTASRGAARLATPEATTVLTSAELLTSAAGALDDALRNTPGFSLFRRSSSRVSNPTTQGVTLRGVSGSGASRTLVLADGLPLNDPFGSWVYWNRVPQAAVDRVEVVRGATGDLYGADALGGVIQVLTFPPGRTRFRATGEGGSHDTARFSGFGGMQRGPWNVDAAGEWLRTDGVIVVGEESRGPVDVRADSDYSNGFLGGGYNAGQWHATVRLSLYDEERGNGTPRTVNSTDWTQVSGEAGGAVGDGAWQVRASGGTQDYYQTFSAVAAGRATERLTFEQTIPTTFATASGQWTRGTAETVWLLGAEFKRARGNQEETRYSVAGVPSGPFPSGGTETNGAMFARVSLTPRDRLTLVLGMRGDFWQSTPSVNTSPTHTAQFFSPRAAAAWTLSPVTSVHASVYRAHRTPTLNELHRRFAVGNTVTNANPLLDPERLTGVDGGALFSWRQLSARVTGFWNQLDEAITNVTITPPPVPGQITRQRQNTDTVRARGLEVEADYRPHPQWTVSALAGVTRSTFVEAPVQPALVDKRVPQVPSYQLGATVTYVDPRGFTGSLQARRVGAQFDDDLNVFRLEPFGVVDVFAGQELMRGLHLFVAVENLGDVDYDVGRTPIRTIGWPRTVRVGVRVFLP
ncbi:MAG: TonB-dependent receptor [Acidobacteria bacterium]|nr:TonB-dependent receptor [Acidobacteriota bacterium]